MKKHNLILVTFFSLTMATGCYNDHILDKPITMLANDKKTALTPPTTYHYSYGLQSGTQDPIWYFKNHSNNQISSITYTRTLVSGFYNYDSGYFQGLPTMDIRFRFYGAQSAWFEFGGGRYEPWYNYIGNYTGMVAGSLKHQFNFDNFGKYNYRVYFDVSSASTSYSNYYACGINPNDNSAVNFLYPTTLRSLIVPAFSSMTFYSYSADAKIDAIYFEQLDITQGMAGYANENYNSGYSEGFDDGFRSVDNLQWLENVATAVKDIFSVEILPGFTVGFIVLFPLVVAIVKWFLSLFGIGGGS